MIETVEARVSEDWRDPEQQDRSTPVITACDLGPMSTLSAKTLRDMGFANIAYLDKGTEPGKAAGMPTTPPTDG